MLSPHDTMQSSDYWRKRAGNTARSRSPTDWGRSTDSLSSLGSRSALGLSVGPLPLLERDLNDPVHARSGEHSGALHVFARSRRDGVSVHAGGRSHGWTPRRPRSCTRSRSACQTLCPLGRRSWRCFETWTGTGRGWWRWGSCGKAFAPSECSCLRARRRCDCRYPLLLLVNLALRLSPAVVPVTVVVAFAAAAFASPITTSPPPLPARGCRR